MLLEKDFVMQGGVRNYLGETEEVQAPKYWKSSKNSPETELAYITEAEKNLLLDASLKINWHTSSLSFSFIFSNKFS